MNLRRFRHAAQTAFLVLCALAVLALPSAAENPDDSKRQEWVQKYEELRAHNSQLEADLAQAQTDYSRGRSTKHLRGKGKAGLIEEIDRLEKELAESQQKLQDFPEEARRQGALPGWFRDDPAPASAASDQGASDQAASAARGSTGLDRSASSRRIGSRSAEPEPAAAATNDEDSDSLSDRRAKKREQRRRLD